jgi:hypothetical protein
MLSSSANEWNARRMTRNSLPLESAPASLGAGLRTASGATRSRGGMVPWSANLCHFRRSTKEPENRVRRGKMSANGASYASAKIGAEDNRKLLLSSMPQETDKRLLVSFLQFLRLSRKSHPGRDTGPIRVLKPLSGSPLTPSSQRFIDVVS